MNTKGFTLIELVGVVLILALIFLISFPNLLNTASVDEERKYNNMVKDLCKAGESYIYANKAMFNNNFQNKTNIEINISDLIEYGNVNSELTNPKTNKKIDKDNLVFEILDDKSLQCEYEEV